MNWAALAAVAAMGTFAAVIIGGAFIYGRLTEKVVGNTDTLRAHEVRLDSHDDQLTSHAVDLGRLHEWKDGFNAGSRSATGTHDL